MSKYIPSALRKLVYDRAKGCCEYCLIPEIATLSPHEIDHIIAEKHDGLTEANNLALCCVLCNKHKGSDIASIDPVTKLLTSLYNPRQDNWREHFQLNDAEFIPLTAVGRITVKLLQINRIDRLKERELLIQAGILKPPVE